MVPFVIYTAGHQTEMAAGIVTTEQKIDKFVNI